MDSRNYFIKSIIAIALLILAPGILVVVIDPYHIFHKPIFKKHGFDQHQMFFHVPGMINNYLFNKQESYTAAAIGASTASGYTEDLFKKNLGWERTLNLSISGSNAAHHSIIAKRILGHPEIKHLFWDLSFHYAYEDYNIEAFDTPQSEEPMPQYLYNESAFDDYRYIFNITTVISSLKIIFGDFSDFNMSIECNSSWLNQKEIIELFHTYSKKENLKDYLSILDRKPRNPLNKSERNNIKYPVIDNRLLPVLMPYCNSDIDIILSIPPRSRYSFSTLDMNYAFYSELYMRRYLVEKTSQCKNFKIFAFDNVDEISGDIHNYADNVHFKHEIYKKILLLISENHNRLTPENIDQYEQDVIQKINDYPDYLERSINNP